MWGMYNCSIFILQMFHGHICFIPMTYWEKGKLYQLVILFHYYISNILCKLFLCSINVLGDAFQCSLSYIIGFRINYNDGTREKCTIVPLQYYTYSMFVYHLFQGHTGRKILLLQYCNYKFQRLYMICSKDISGLYLRHVMLFHWYITNGP